MRIETLQKGRLRVVVRAERFFQPKNTNGPSLDNYSKEKSPEERDVFEIEGRNGLFTEIEMIFDKYMARPEGVENLTLSQFATSYTRCTKKPKNLAFNDKNVTNETGSIIDHITEEHLPCFIQMSTNDIYRVLVHHRLSKPATF